MSRGVYRMALAKILVVEDDTALLEGLRDVLELAGFGVLTASNGVEGLETLTTHPLPDLIISDIMMPRMDGYEFYTRVREKPDWLNVPFIFLTAKGEKTDIRRGKQLGADDYLIKPFEEEDLLVAIESKLKRRAQLESARDLQMDDLKRRILTTLNHEFRTPLTYITTYTDMLNTAEPNISSDEFKQFMRGIQAGSERLRHLVEDFIALVELQTGETQRAYETRRQLITDLSEVLLRVVEQHQLRALTRKVRLEATVPAALPPVWGEIDQLTSAVSRLVENGIKFSKKEGGWVRVMAHSTVHKIVIQVQDDGVGIRTTELSNLFNPLHQVDRAKMEQQGSGSGLAIARGIVAIHGGQLTVTSELGVGSLFSLELPTQDIA